MKRLVLTICAASALGFQCGKAPPATSATPDASETPDAPAAEPNDPQRLSPPGTLAMMDKHFNLALYLKDAVISGDVEAGRLAAMRLSESDIAGQPETWLPFMADMRAAAKMASEAGDIHSQARAVAELGQTCGACHRELGVGPDSQIIEIPNQEWSSEDHMPRHQWSMNWMWLGLIAPSQFAFKRGASELAERPIVGEEYVPSTLDERVHQIARDALAKAGDEQAQVKAVGDLLSTCAECHSGAGTVPP